MLLAGGVVGLGQCTFACCAVPLKALPSLLWLLCLLQVHEEVLRLLLAAAQHIPLLDVSVLPWLLRVPSLMHTAGVPRLGARGVKALVSHPA